MMDPAVRMKAMMTDLEKKVSTKEEHYRSCALWLLEDECWNDCRPQPYPMKSDAVMSYSKEPYKERIKLDPQYFKEDPEGIEVLNYVTNMYYAYQHNKARLDTLRFLSRYVDGEAKKHYYERIKDFADVVIRGGFEIINYLPPLPAFNLKRELSQSDDFLTELVREFKGVIE